MPDVAFIAVALVSFAIFAWMANLLSEV